MELKRGAEMVTTIFTVSMVTNSRLVLVRHEPRARRRHSGCGGWSGSVATCESVEREKRGEILLVYGHSQAGVDAKIAIHFESVCIVLIGKLRLTGQAAIHGDSTVEAGLQVKWH